MMPCLMEMVPVRWTTWGQVAYCCLLAFPDSGGIMDNYDSIKNTTLPDCLKNKDTTTIKKYSNLYEME